jgi:cyclopropane fatty-acyl-phospholipid synthase-like methyltransferase
MPNSLLNFVKRMQPLQSMGPFFSRLRQGSIGLAQDFWKDGHWEKPEDDFVQIHESPVMPTEAVVLQGTGGLWHAQPGEISEKMWGQGYVTPGDEFVTDLLMGPLGITKDMGLLDLSAGLGGRLRKATTKFGVYITGLEPDPEIAARGMALSVSEGRGTYDAIAAYDPMTLTSSRVYDCIVARETIYRVSDKAKFIRSIAACCKPKAQVSFTDYIVNPELRDKPAIVAWRAFEKGADPIGLLEMAEIWAKTGISIRVHDDQTEYYKKEVKKGLVAFSKFMASGVKPDEQTKAAIEKRIMIWAHRIAAIDEGMKFYRFYGLR